MKQTLTILLSCVSLCAFSQAGTLDPTFGSGGKVTTSIGSPAYDYGKAIAVQSDGKVVVAGSSGLSPNNFAVARYNTNGTPDITFSGDGKQTTDFGADEEVTSVLIQPDGKIVVAGFTYDTEAATASFAIARYNSNGTLDNTFDGDGMLTTIVYGEDNRIISIKLQPDGKLVVGGVCGYEGANNYALARYNANGSLDNTFGSGGKVITTFGLSDEVINSIALQADGKIVAAGDALDANGYDFTVLRYNSNGTLDNTFGTGGKVTTDLGGDLDQAYAIAVQSNGKIVVSGSSGDVSIGTSDFAIVRYNSNGSLDNTFSGDGKQTTDIGLDDEAIVDVAFQTDGKIVVGGVSGDGYTLGGYRFVAARYTSAGTLDGTFGTSGLSTVNFSGDDEAYAMKMSGSRIYLAGYTNTGSDANFALAALRNDAVPLPLTLTAFSAAKQAIGIQLKWTTVNEQNILSFEIERGDDGRSFQKIASVKAVGNSLDQQNYSFVDAKPLSTANHYRLRILEGDGKVTYSQIVVVKLASSAKLEVYPNPARNIIHVQFNATDAKQILLRDASGRMIKSIAISQQGNISTSVDISSLQTGMYFLTAGSETIQFAKE